MFCCLFYYYAYISVSNLKTSSCLIDKNSDVASALNVNGDDSTSRDDFTHKNDILKKALERSGLPLSENGPEYSG